jgi:hypothetical protein
VHTLARTRARVCACVFCSALLCTLTLRVLRARRLRTDLFRLRDRIAECEARNGQFLAQSHSLEAKVLRAIHDIDVSAVSSYGTSAVMGGAGGTSTSSAAMGIGGAGVTLRSIPLAFGAQLLPRAPSAPPPPPPPPAYDDQPLAMSNAPAVYGGGSHSVRAADAVRAPSYPQQPPQRLTHAAIADDAFGASPAAFGNAMDADTEQAYVMSSPTRIVAGHMQSTRRGFEAAASPIAHESYAYATQQQQQTAAPPPPPPPPMPVSRSASAHALATSSSATATGASAAPIVPIPFSQRIAQQWTSDTVPGGPPRGTVPLERHMLESEVEVVSAAGPEVAPALAFAAAAPAAAAALRPTMAPSAASIVARRAISDGPARRYLHSTDSAASLT